MILSLRTVGSLITILPLLGGCVATKTSKVSVDYYSINGNSTAALDREIRNKGPKVDGGRHAVAVARIRIVPNIDFTPGNASCTITAAKVPVDARVTLPRWSGRKNASKDLGEAWDNIDRYTRLHEATHVAIAFRYAKQLENKLMALAPAQNCQQLRAIAKEVVNSHLQSHDKEQKKFDADEQKRFAHYASKSRKVRTE